MAFHGGVPSAAAARTTTRLVLLVGLLVVLAVFGAGLGDPVRAFSPPTTTAVPRGGDHRDSLGQAAGAVPGGTTVFDDEVPGVAELDPALLAALRRAAADAGASGVTFVVNSGWRSRAYQEHLRRRAIAKYGSEAAAARWVAAPDTSSHVSGDAVDLGAAAAQWLGAHGAAYGLCRTYANEPWHFELRPDAVARGCPPMYADAQQRGAA